MGDEGAGRRDVAVAAGRDVGAASVFGGGSAGRDVAIARGPDDVGAASIFGEDAAGRAVGDAVGAARSTAVGDSVAACSTMSGVVLGRGAGASNTSTGSAPEAAALGGADSPQAPTSSAPDANAASVTPAMIRPARMNHHRRSPAGKRPGASVLSEEVCVMLPNLRFIRQNP